MRLHMFARLCAIAVLLLSAAPGFGQGLQTSVLTGTVTDQDELVLPGATVTVSSPALQGTRQTVTDENGVYAVRGLPPGEYTLVFELAGMRTTEATQRVELGLAARVDARLLVGAVAETVTVTAEAPSMTTTVSVGANYRGEMIDKLASPRTIQAVTELAPGLTENTPNANQVTIAGGFAYDNQLLVDGVDVADNLLGQANTLFIEDAIEEVQVLTSGISSEFGRFGGGVVNAITRSGSNRFAGSLRNNQYKPSWTTRTPYEEANNLARTGDLQNVYEWTLGGPILRDRVWFFHAGRRQQTTTPQPFPQTRIANSNTNQNNRFELKGTATVADAQTIQGQYLRNNTTQHQPSLGFSIDPSTVVSRRIPNDLIVGSWRGVISRVFYATAQVSRREYGVEHGGTASNIVDSPFLSRGFLQGVPSTQQFNAPYFDATDPEYRNNRQVTGSLSYFLTTDRVGSHDVKVGYENFQSSRIGGNSQSSTGYVFRTDYRVEAGVPVLDENQRPVPVFVPGLSRIENYVPTRGAELDITTQSLFVHDRWAFSPRLSFDLGLRGEFVRSEATGGIVGVDTTTWVPRLGATYNLTEDGATTVQTTYARYAGKYSEAQIGRNTPVGNANLLLYEYRGPGGEGRGFAPGFDLANYVVISGSFPLENVVFDKGLRSPTTDEFTVSVARLVRRGAVKATYQWRSISGFIEDFTDDPSATGKVTILQNGRDFGTFDNTYWRNSDAPVREYRAMIFQGHYRLANRWTANGHWTLQLRNHGNFEGELQNQPGIASATGDYPEVFGFDWERQNPQGRLNDFQRSKVRTWTTVTSSLGAFGTLDWSATYRYNSPLTYSLAATNQPLSAIQLARNPGYARAAGVAQSLFFDERGSESFEASHQVDVGLLYQLPVWGTVRPWCKVELYNVFNNQALVSFNTSVTPDPNSAGDANGLPTGFIRGASFGTATRVADYPRATTTPGGTALYARTFLMSFGIRF